MRPSRPAIVALPQQTSLVRRPSIRVQQSLWSTRCLHQSCTYRKRSSSKYPFFPGSSSDNGGQVPMQRKERRDSKTPRVQDHSFKPYTESDRAQLATTYSPAQVAAIEAGEAAISEDDLATQGKMRRDPFQFEYLDDFARIEPVIDKKLERMRASAQRSEDNESYSAAPDELSVLQRAADAELDAEIEDVGGWVPVRPKNDEEKEQMYQGPLTKLELRRTPHQLAKAALKEYLGTPTVKSAFEYCWRKDAEISLETDVPDIKGAVEVAQRRTSLRERLSGSQLQDLSLDDDQPFHSPYFEEFIRPDPRYEAILQSIINNPPSPRHFGSPALESKLREAFDPPMSDVAPEIPRIQDPSVRWGVSEDDMAENTSSAIEGLEGEALDSYLRTAKALGKTIDQLRSYRVKTITSHRVVNQTKMGKISSMYFLCAAGNERGMLGIGEGKASEAEPAARMARLNAIKNMVPILRYEDRTIYGEVQAKVGASKVKLSARQPGFGLRTPQHIFEIARCVGLADLSAKVTRGRNPMNVAKAVWEALRSQRDPEDVARARGKKFVDARKVYYSGLA